MPRRAEIPVRELDPDPVYSSKLVSQVINKVMNRGKKSTAEQIVYRALDMVGEKTGKPPVEILEQRGADRIQLRRPIQLEPGDAARCRVLHRCRVHVASRATLTSSCSHRSPRGSGR